MNRLLLVTLRVLAVMAVWTPVASPAGAEEGQGAVASDLRAAARDSAPLPERIAALERAAAAPSVGDSDSALRAAVSLVEQAPAPATRLLLRALSESPASDDLVEAARGRFETPDVFRSADPARQALLGAFAVLLGVRRGVPVFNQWPPAPTVADVLRWDAPEVAAFRPADLALWPKVPPYAEWDRHAEAAGLLDRAALDAAGSGEGETPMARLVASKEAALGHLLAVASPPSEPAPGRTPRRVRAIVALGLCGDRAATPVLLRALDDRDGWVRVAAAYALGDLGDPAAVAPLCRVLFYLGDRHRLHDSWDYPGRDNVPVTAEEWRSVEYHAIDCAAADALLRLGVRGAGGWLIERKLDPRVGNWRVRVLQDAVDALRRAFPSLSVEYRTDGSVPHRLAAWRAFRRWWRETEPRVARPLDEADPAFREGAASLVRAVVGPSVMEQQIASGCVGLLGPAMTPSLLEALPGETKRPHRAQLAIALGDTGDPRAIPALVGLARESASSVRAAAASALGAFVGSDRAALDAVLALLSDPDSHPRAAAVEALAGAPVDPRVGEAVRAAAAARASSGAGDDLVAERVVRLVQTGEGLERVLEDLRSEHLWRRRHAWDLLRRALGLDPDLFDPGPAPGSPESRPIDAEAVRGALEARRRR
jgi:HEAT repeat protein